MIASVAIVSFFLGCALAIWIAIACGNAAYRNGCRDGFRLAHEPLHPACMEAGEVIRGDATLAHYLNEVTPESKT
jgi:hypothetical protein